MQGIFEMRVLCKLWTFGRGDNCICKGETIFLIHVKLIVELIGGLNLVTSEYENYIRLLHIRIHVAFFI